MFNRNTARWLVMVAALMTAALMLSGCARKVVQAPLQTAVVPPQTQPKPAETPTETPPTPPEQPSGDATASGLQPVFFDLDASTLRDDARSTLDANARHLRDHLTVRIVIEGHCDERGTVEYNQALGERRAQAARDYLQQAGISESRLHVISYGKERPFDPGHDEAAWAKNRRAHFALQ